MTWRAWLVRLATLLALAVTLRAGFWQLDRAAQRDAAQARVQAQAQATVLDNAALLGALRASGPAGADQPAGQPTPGWQDRRVQLRGHWLPEHTVYLDNRAMDGAAGFFVTTPLVLEARAQMQPAQSDGDSASGNEVFQSDARLAAPSSTPASAQQMPTSNRADPIIWVQRGWAPRHAQDRTRLPPVHTPAGAVQVEGRLAPQLSQAYALGADAVGPIRQNLTLTQMQAMVTSPMLGAVVVQTGPASDGLLRNWPPPASGAAKNRGYAVQWFGMAGLILILYVWFQFLRPLVRRSAPPA
jgi:surfeit locus 1 family protein